MSERGIIFSGPMVRAILSGSKTVTRRLVKPQPLVKPEYTGPHCNEFGVWFWTAYPDRPGYAFATQDRLCNLRGNDDRVSGKTIQPGDRLWVRETLNIVDHEPEHLGACVQYAADEQIRGWTHDDPGVRLDWPKRKVVPSIHMPKWAARIWLEVVSVRPERLHEITEEDAIAEGMEKPVDSFPRGPRFMANVFRGVWEHLHGPGSWDANPWVWVIKFKRVGDGLGV